MLSAKALVRRFGSRTAVDGIGLEVRAGEVVALLGPNGAGKTTTLRMLAGVLEPDAGTITVEGFDLVASRTLAQARIGHLPEGAPLWGEMTPEGHLRFLADIRGMPRADRAAAIALAVEATGLGPALGRPIDTLSKGFRRRVALAGAMLHAPSVLLLDEPTDGLDPNQKRAARRLVRALAADRAIVISTHSLEEVEAVCDRAIVIAEGRVVADSTPALLAAQAPSGRLDEAFAALTSSPEGASA